VGFCYKKEQQMDNIIKFQKGHLIYLAQWLDTPVPKSQNRHRNEFLKMISPINAEVEQDRIKMVRGYCKADDEGKVIMENGQMVFKSDDDMRMAQKEYEEMLAEEVNVVITKPHALDFVKEFLARTNLNFRTADGIAYDEICDILNVTITEDTPPKSNILLP